ncbi:MAG: hypothetical protein H7Y15_13455 [Pseudonocardia sp.]|nr:hypothetical protein [Pseudonocardia sp.]
MNYPQCAVSYAEDTQRWSASESGHHHMHITRPDTCGAALLDSPAGTAAWLGEMFRDRSSNTGLGLDWILTTLPIYWLTGTITSSMRRYAEDAHRSRPLRPGQRPPVPIGFSISPTWLVHLPSPLRSLAERRMDLTHRRVLDRGGHFPAPRNPHSSPTSSAASSGPSVTAPAPQPQSGLDSTF